MVLVIEQRWPNVTPVRDRHGKVRWRYRRKGVKGGYVHGEPGSPEWIEDYQRLAAEQPTGAVSPRFTAPRSFDDLARRYRGSPRWARMQPSSRYTFGRLIDRLLDKTDSKGNRFGARPVAAVTVASLDKMLGKMADTPGTANNMRKVLRMLFAYAVKLGWRADNPALLTDGFRGGPGFATWTEDDIAAYRERHALGTTARLVMELALNTAARRCNVATLRRDQLRGGKFHIEHAKGGEATIVRAQPMTITAIDAMPVAGIGHFAVNAYGRPFSIAGLGNKMRKWCDEAGLKGRTLHGLRKAQSRRLAEAGATDAQGRAVTGQKKNQTFAYYAQMANREGLADAAMSNLEKPELTNPSNL